MWPTVLVPTGPRRPPPGPRQAHGASGGWGRRGGERAGGRGAAGRGQAAPRGWRGHGCAKALCSLQPRASGAGRGEGPLVPPPAPAPAASCSQVSVARRRSVASRRPPEDGCLRTGAADRQAGTGHSRVGWWRRARSRSPPGGFGAGGAVAPGEGSVGHVPSSAGVQRSAVWFLLPRGAGRGAQRALSCGSPASWWPARAGTEGVPAGPRDLTDCCAPLLLSVELFSGGIC